MIKEREIGECTTRYKNNITSTDGRLTTFSTLVLGTTKVAMAVDAITTNMLEAGTLHSAQIREVALQPLPWFQEISSGK